MIFDSDVKDVISSAYDCGKDVFLKMPVPHFSELSFDNVKTVVFLPGAFYFSEDTGFSDVRIPPHTYEDFSSRNILFSDIRFLADEFFRQFLTENSFGRLIVIFAECADKTEYGYRESFSWIREYKAEISHFCQTVAFFPPVSSFSGELVSVLSDREVLFLGEDEDREISAFAVISQKEKFSFLMSSALKYAYQRVCIYFNSRGEATDFCRYLKSNGTDFVYIDGTLPSDELRDNVISFSESNPNILVATKTYIPSSFFCPPERVLVGGVPFSVSHLYRMSAFCDIKPLIVYTEDDFIRNKRIIRAFSDTDEDSEIADKRLLRLSEIKNRILNKN